MFIRDKSSVLRFFEQLEGGAIFGCDGGFYCKLSCEVYDGKTAEGVDLYNAVNLYDGEVCKFGDKTPVENLAGHTLELSD